MTLRTDVVVAFMTANHGRGADDLAVTVVACPGKVTAQMVVFQNVIAGTTESHGVEHVIVCAVGWSRGLSG